MPVSAQYTPPSSSAYKLASSTIAGKVSRSMDTRRFADPLEHRRLEHVGAALIRSVGASPGGGFSTNASRALGTTPKDDNVDLVEGDGALGAVIVVEGDEPGDVESSITLTTTNCSSMPAQVAANRMAPVVSSGRLLRSAGARRRCRRDASGRKPRASTTSSTPAAARPAITHSTIGRSTTGSIGLGTTVRPPTHLDGRASKPRAVVEVLVSPVAGAVVDVVELVAGSDVDVAVGSMTSVRLFSDSMMSGRGISSKRSGGRSRREVLRSFRTARRRSCR